MNLADRVLSLILLVFSLGVHECAHAWTAYKFGDDTAKRLGRLTLNPLPHIDIIGIIPILLGVFFGWAKPVPVNPHKVRNPSLGLPVIAAAGPVSNLLQMVVGCAVWAVCDGFFGLSFGGGEKIVFDLLWIYIQINLALALFNLLPIYPLDGGRIVSLFLSDEMADRYEASMARFGFMPIFGLILVNMASNGMVFKFWFGLWGPVFNWLFALSGVPINLNRF